MIRKTAITIFTLLTIDAFSADFSKSICDEILALSEGQRGNLNFQLDLQKIREDDREHLDLKGASSYSETQRLILAKALTEINCNAFISFAEEFARLPESNRIELADACIGKTVSFQSILYKLNLSPIPNQKKRFEWAKLDLEQHRNGFQYMLHSFGDFSQAQRVELAERYIRTLRIGEEDRLNTNVSVVVNLKQFGINDEKERIRLMWIYWQRVRNVDFAFFQESYESFNIKDHRASFEIAKSSMRYLGPSTFTKGGAIVTGWLQNLGITRRAEIQELIEIAMSKGSLPNDWDHQGVYQLALEFDKEFVAKLYELCLRRKGDVSVAALPNVYDVCAKMFNTTPRQTVVPQSEILPRLRWAPARTLRVAPFVDSPLRYRSEPITVTERDGFPPTLPQILEDAKKSWAISFPSYDLTDRVKRPTTAVGLLAIWQDVATRPELEKFRAETDSLPVLLGWLGLAENSQKELFAIIDRASADRTAEFYEAALSVGLLIKDPILKDLKSEKRLTKNSLRDLIDFFAAASNLLQLVEPTHRDRLWRSITFSLIDFADLPSTTAKLGAHVVKKIQSLLRSKHQFTYDQLAQLQKSWGSLEAIFTLTARFQGNPSWRKELPILATVFHQVLGGTFKQYKFERTQPLPAAWTEKMLQVSLFDPTDAAGKSQTTETQKFQRLREEYQTGLRMHMLQDDSRPFSNNPGAVYELKTIASREEFEDLKKRLDLNSWQIHQLVKLALDEAENLAQFKTALEFYHSIVKLDVLVDLTQIEADIASLRAVYADRSAEVMKPSIIVTTSTYDPKLLLTIGDIVPTGSCQNYRYGSHIQTLLGYVIDPNIQALLGFVLQAKHFANNKEFEEVFNALKTGTAETKFMEPALAFEFKLNSGKTVRTLDLPYSFRRHIVRLGQADNNQTAALMERAYQQTSDYQPYLEKQANQLFRVWTAKMGAVTSGVMSFAASRNPGGVYSDAGGGVRVGAYEIHVK